MKKASWSHFKHFGRLLGKIYLFLTPSKTDGRVPSQQGATTTCNLTYWEVSQQHVWPDITGQVEYGHKAKFRPLVGGGDWVGRWVWPKGENYLFSGGKWGRGFWQITIISYSRHQIPADTLNYLFPNRNNLPRINNFFPHLPASKHLPEEQIFSGTDPLVAPDILGGPEIFLFPGHNCRHLDPKRRIPCKATKFGGVIKLCYPSELMNEESTMPVSRKVEKMLCPVIFWR